MAEVEDYQTLNSEWHTAPCYPKQFCHAELFKHCHPELSWILFHKKSLLTTLRYRSSDFLFLRVSAIASPYANPLISGSILKDTSLRSVWRKTTRHSEGSARRICKYFVTLNCLGFCFTKSRYLLHFVIVRLTFCSFVSALSLRITQNPLVSGSN